MTNRVTPRYAPNMSEEISTDIVARLDRMEAILIELLATKSPTKASRIRDAINPQVEFHRETTTTRVETIAERLLRMPWTVRRAQKWPAAALASLARIPLPQIVNRTYKHRLFAREIDPCEAVRAAIKDLVAEYPDKWEFDNTSEAGLFLRRKCPAPSPESGPAFWMHYLLSMHSMFKDAHINAPVSQRISSGVGFKESDFPIRFLYPTFKGTFSNVIEEVWRYFIKCLPDDSIPIPGLVDVGDWRAKLDAAGLGYAPGVLTYEREMEAKRAEATAARLEREAAAAGPVGGLKHADDLGSLPARLATLNAYREDLASGASVDQYVELCSTWLGRSRLPSVPELTDAMEAWADGAEEAIAPLRCMD